MFDLDTIIFLILITILLTFVIINRKKVELQKIAFPILYMIIFRTKLGLNKMDKLAKKFPKTLNVISYISIIIGYIGMAFIVFFLLKGAYDFMFNSMPSPVGLVLPKIQVIPGLPVLSFMHWIMAIVILASVHEFSHGVFARLHKIKVKSSGFALLGILLPIVPAAFVEPDEEEMGKASKKAQLSVLSAGSFANFITAIVALLIFLFVLAPISGNMIQETGVLIVNLEENGPAALTGIQPGEEVISLNSVSIKDLSHFKQEMEQYSPYEKIDLETNVSTYYLTLGEDVDDPEKAHLGVFLLPKEQIYNPEIQDKYGTLFIKFFIWLTILFSWLFMINLGVGMFNLLPLGILDGGKMFYLGVLGLTKNNEVLTNKIWKWTNVFFITILLLLILPQLFKILVMPLISFII